MCDFLEFYRVFLRGFMGYFQEVFFGVLLRNFCMSFYLIGFCVLLCNFLWFWFVGFIFGFFTGFIHLIFFWGFLVDF